MTIDDRLQRELAELAGTPGDPGSALTAIATKAAARRRRTRLRLGTLGVATAAAAVILTLLVWPDDEPARRLSTEPGPPTTVGPTTTEPVTLERPPPQPDVFFVDRDHGWATGAGGIMATTDGGRTWRVQRQHDVNVGPITFLDTRIGWAEEGGTIIATTDGGATWEQLGKAGAIKGASQLTFLDRHSGWAVLLENRCTFSGGCTDVGSLVHTVDGGATWEQADDQRVDRMCWTGQRGWVGSGTSVRTTTDGGATWAPVAVPLRGEGVSDISCSGDTAWVSAFYGAGMSQAVYEVFRTSDGGAHWGAVLASRYGPEDPRNLPAIDAYNGPVAASSAGAAVFVGSCAPCGEVGTISVTTTRDGGRTFAHHQVTTENDPGDSPMAVTFPDPDHGWILGSSGTVYATSDAGVTWTRQTQSPLLVPDWG